MLQERDFHPAGQHPDKRNEKGAALVNLACRMKPENVLSRRRSDGNVHPKRPSNQVLIPPHHIKNLSNRYQSKEKDRPDLLDMGHRLLTAERILV